MPTYTPDTRIEGPSHGSPEAWYLWAVSAGCKRPADVRQYLDTVYEFAPKAGLPAEMIVTQSIHETSVNGVPWASYWWQERCNPAGIGITGNPAQNNASRVFKNGREAALAHLVHFHLYVKGKDLPAGLSPEMDPRWDAAAGVSTIVGKKKTLRSFGGAATVTTWAVDPDYGSKWAGHLNRLAPVFANIEVPEDDGSGDTDNGEEPQMAQFSAVIAMGHRNTDRGGASNEINWTPSCARAIAAAIRAHGGKAIIVQEQDSDGDPNWYPGGLQAMARHAVALASKHGPFDIYISCHYNGGAGAGAHAIFPDGPSGDSKADNPLDVKFCENFAAAIKATGTVGLIQYPRHGPGIMSERETGVGGQGFRLGEMVGSIGFRARTVRTILEAGSIDVARERAYINDAGWVRNVYAEAVVKACKQTFPNTSWGTVTPPVDPPKYAAAVAIPELDKYLSGDVPMMPASIPFSLDGAAYIGIPVSNTVKVIATGGTRRAQKPTGTADIGPLINLNEEFELAFTVVKVGDPVAEWGRTKYGTWVRLADLGYVAD